MAATKKERQLRREAVRRILLDDKMGPLQDQKFLVKLLEAMGIKATQASVSRDLRELGAVWVDGHYEIPTWDPDGIDPLDLVLPLIVVVKPAAENQALIVTRRGAGPVVAEAIEARLGDDIVGTVAGHSSVLVVCLHQFFRDLFFDRLRCYLEPEDEEEKPRPAAGETAPPQEEA